MGAHLDLNDVAHGHPVAERELRALLDVVREAIAVIDSADAYYKGADQAALEALHLVILNHDLDKLAAAQEQNNEEPQAGETEGTSPVAGVAGGSSPSQPAPEDGTRAAFEAWWHGGAFDSGPYRRYPDGEEKCHGYAAWQAAHARIFALLRARQSRLPDTPEGHGEEAWLDEIIDEIEGRA